MSIKSYLRSALKAFVGKESAPSYSESTRISYGTAQTGTAGASGVLCIRAITTNSSTPWVSVDINNRTVANWNCSWFSGGGSSMCIQIRAGDSFQIFIADVRIESVFLYKTSANIV